MPTLIRTASLGLPIGLKIKTPPGQRYSLPPQRRSISLAHLVSDLVAHHELVAAACLNDINTNNMNSMNQPTSFAVRNLQRKLKHGQVAVTKADKGNCIDLMNRANYDTKIDEFLDSSKCKIANISSPFVFRF